MSDHRLEALRAQLRALETELDESEGEVERALTAGMWWAIIGTLGIVLGVGTDVYLIS